MKNISNLAYNNKKYYAIFNKNKLVILNEMKQKIKEKQLAKTAISISANKSNNDLYLIFEDCKNLIEVFDDKLAFKYKFEFNGPNSFNEKIRNITYCAKLKGILVVTDKSIFLISLTGELIKVIFKVDDDIAKCDGCVEPLGECLEEKLETIDAVCCNHNILVAYKYCNLYHVTIVKNQELETIIYTSEQEIKRMFIKDNYVWLLAAHNCKNNILCTSIECSECDCESTTIIDSIAAIEKCLAQILCAEAAKIKAAIKNTNDNCELLQINESVNKLIYRVTLLEFILTEKLQIATSYNECKNNSLDC